MAHLYHQRLSKLSLRLVLQGPDLNVDYADLSGLWEVSENKIPGQNHFFVKINVRVCPCDTNDDAFC